jgi:hypothetical protein
VLPVTTQVHPVCCNLPAWPHSCDVSPVEDGGGLGRVLGGGLGRLGEGGKFGFSGGSGGNGGLAG